jgi:hypothetical protein
MYKELFLNSTDQETYITFPIQKDIQCKWPTCSSTDGLFLTPFYPPREGDNKKLRLPSWDRSNETVCCAMRPVMVDTAHYMLETVPHKTKPQVIGSNMGEEA